MEDFAQRVRAPVLMGKRPVQFHLPARHQSESAVQGTRHKESDKRHVLYDGGHRNFVTRQDLIGEILDWFRPLSRPDAAVARELNLCTGQSCLSVAIGSIRPARSAGISAAQAHAMTMQRRLAA